jgi:AraC-type DNA-binding domain-containing proteins
MDALVSLLAGPRARGAFLVRALVDPPWSLRVVDGAPLTMVAVMRGSACLLAEGAPPVRLGAEDVAVVRGPAPYGLADDPATPAQAVIHPGGCARSVTGEDLCDSMDLGVRTWGRSLSAGTMLLVGTYQMRDEVTRRLLEALPPSLVLRRDDWDRRLLPLLHDEIVRDGPGQDVLLDRLLDLLLVAVLRAWFARADTAPAWFRAHADPVVGAALRLLHDNPAHPWTVASLATRLGVSRAALARRFTRLVGEPPMTYLTNRRLDLAADLLRDPEITLGAVAHRVGYSTPFALSAAFKRIRGVSPRQLRPGGRAGEGAPSRDGDPEAVV